ncbi:hypothetical protein EPN44_00745 [bacterium]|nr:MAG: hypothetical protein EPN44_00745 [bacterium]
MSGSCQPPPAPGTGTAYALGAARTWCLSVATIGTSNVTYESVATTLLAQGTHLNVWIDNADQGQLTQTQWQQIATDFDAIYTADTTYFGNTTFPWLGSQQSQYTFSECDNNGSTLPASQYVNQPNFSSGNGNNGNGAQIDMVVTDKLGTGEGGYFNALDLVSNASARCTASYSNEAQVFFAEPPGSMPQSFYLNGDVLRTEAHEFQHMLHAINKTYAVFASTGVQVRDPSWIDEGFSMLAEDLAYPSSPGPSGDPIRYAFAYVNAPSNYSLTSFEGLDCAPTATSANCPMSIYNYTAGNYGAAYLFWRWVMDQKGAGALRQVIANSDAGPNNSGVNEVLAATGYSSFTQLFDDFEMAVAASQKYGPLGGSVYAYTAQSNQDAFDNSYGQYTIPSPCQQISPEPNVSCNLVNHTATFSFPGPQPPSSLSGGSLSATTGSQTLSLYAGSANFIPISGTTTGQDSFSAFDTSGSAGIVGGYAAQTAMVPVSECAPVSNKIGCTVTGNPMPTNVLFVAGMGNPPAGSGPGAATLAQYAITLAAQAGGTPPASITGPASIARLPQATGPRTVGDGFLRADRPAAVGHQALSRLFGRGVVHTTLLQGLRRR